MIATAGLSLGPPVSPLPVGAKIALPPLEAPPPPPPSHLGENNVNGCFICSRPVFAATGSFPLCVLLHIPNLSALTGCPGSRIICVCASPAPPLLLLSSKTLSICPALLQRKIPNLALMSS